MMRRIFIQYVKFVVFLLFIALTSSVVVAQAEIRPEIGDVLKKEHIPKEPKEMAARCCFYPFVEKTIGGVNYTIAFERDTREIVFLATWDKAFRTKEGYRVGDCVQVSFEQTSSSGATLFGAETGEGWFPVVGYDLKLQTKEGVWENLNPFENMEPDEVLTVKIHGFQKGMWGK